MSDGVVAPRINIGNLIEGWALLAQVNLKRHCETTACRDLCKVHTLKKKKNVTNSILFQRFHELMSNHCTGSPRAICPGSWYIAYAVRRQESYTSVYFISHRSLRRALGLKRTPHQKMRCNTNLCTTGRFRHVAYLRQKTPGLKIIMKTASWC